MEVRCYHCLNTQTVEDDIFGEHEKVEVPCTSCGKAFQIINPKLATFRSQATRKTVPSITSEISVDGLPLHLPPNQEISLKVIEGHEKGTIYPMHKPRITIGRANSDVIINDMLSSRIHCAVEVSGQTILLRDLESTNGTFFKGEPIQTAVLSSGSVFKIGTHSFELVIHPKAT
ncbi:MAG TPA: FHA domain-containing protein [Terriglobia bacterium]|nr:FHA domain-containing protein [Terriglobia bacterium]